MLGLESADLAQVHRGFRRALMFHHVFHEVAFQSSLVRALGTLVQLQLRLAPVAEHVDLERVPVLALKAATVAVERPQLGNVFVGQRVAFDAVLVSRFERARFAPEHFRLVALSVCQHVLVVLRFTLERA